jgi:hypothetical protein
VVTSSVPWRAGLATAAAIVVLAACQFAWVRPTNFLGYDEWMILWLTSRGIVSQPHAGRPLMLAGSLPAVWLAPDRLAGPYVLLGTYLALSGVLVFALCRAVAPRLGAVAALAGAITAVWAPLDYQRLDTVHMTPYGAVVFGTLLTLVLFLASLRRDSVLLLGAAGLAAIVTAFAYEATLPLLLVPPLVATAVWPGLRRRLAWAAAWTFTAALGAMPAAAVYLQRRGAPAYQAAYQTDLHPWRMAGRLWHHHAFDLAPAALTPLSQVAVPPAAIAAAALVVVMLAARWEGPPAPGPDGRRALMLCAAAGLGLAALGHLFFITSDGLTTPNRTQFLCAPGTGLFLASAAALVASLLPERLRLGGLTLLGAWIVAVSAGKTVAHQHTWDARSAYPAQAQLLTRLVALAPDLKPDTLVVLLDGRDAWRDTYGFDHAVRYLYEGRARGHVWQAPNLFYPTAFAPDRIRLEPRADIRDAWEESPLEYHYDQTIALRHAADGEVVLLERWPARVATTPMAESYDPRARIVTGRPAPPSRRILR